jgi:hypothetical protein
LRATRHDVERLRVAGRWIRHCHGHWRCSASGAGERRLGASEAKGRQQFTGTKVADPAPLCMDLVLWPDPADWGAAGTGSDTAGGRGRRGRAGGSATARPARVAPVPARRLAQAAGSGGVGGATGGRVRTRRRCWQQDPVDVMGGTDGSGRVAPVAAGRRAQVT